MIYFTQTFFNFLDFFKFLCPFLKIFFVFKHNFYIFRYIFLYIFLYLPIGNLNNLQFS